MLFKGDYFLAWPGQSQSLQSQSLQGQDGEGLNIVYATHPVVGIAKSAPAISHARKEFVHRKLLMIQSPFRKVWTCSSLQHASVSQ